MALCHDFFAPSAVRPNSPVANEQNVINHSTCIQHGSFVLQMMRQQMLLTQTMIDFMSRSALGTVPPMPGMQVPATGGGQSSSSSNGPSERLTMDTKWIPAAPLPEWKTWNSRASSLLVSRDGWRSLHHGYVLSMMSMLLNSRRQHEQRCCDPESGSGHSKPPIPLALAEFFGVSKGRQCGEISDCFSWHSRSKWF